MSVPLPRVLVPAARARPAANDRRFVRKQTEATTLDAPGVEGREPMTHRLSVVALALGGPLLFILSCAELPQIDGSAHGVFIYEFELRSPTRRRGRFGAAMFLDLSNFEDTADATVTDSGGPSFQTSGNLSGSFGRVGVELSLYSPTEKYEYGVSLGLGNVSGLAFDYQDAGVPQTAEFDSWNPTGGLGFYFRARLRDRVRVRLEASANGLIPLDAFFSETNVLVEYDMAPWVSASAGWRWMRSATLLPEAGDDVNMDFDVSGPTVAASFRF